MTVKDFNYTGKRVDGEGLLSSKIVLVGEAPGVVEAREGRPFSPNAPAGKLLQELLHSVGLTRQDVYITNVIKERPPKRMDGEDDLSKWFRVNSQGGVTVTKDYIRYKEMLRNELEKINANVFVPAGNVALYALTGLIGIIKLRGSIINGSLFGDRVMKVVPIIHPAAALPHKNPIYKYLIKADLKRVVEESSTPEINLPMRNLKILLSYNEVCAYLESCKNAEVVSIDIEVLNEEISHVGIAKDWDDAISIPFTARGDNYLSPPQEAYIWRLIADILEDDKIIKINHNISFDAAFIFRKFGVVIKNVKDTMVMMGILFPDLPKNLGFVSSLYTKEPYYKDERKKMTKLYDERKFSLYNAKDAAVVLEIAPKLEDELRKQSNYETYKWQERLIYPCIYIQERGLKIDVGRLEAAKEEADKRLIDIESKIKEMVGYDINPRSTQQLVKYFYDELGVEPYTKRGKPTVDQTAIKRLTRKGIPVASLLQEYRKLHKFKSSYLDMKIGDDGRLHSSINPVGTTSGRLSASKDIFGEGGNIQTLPKAFYPFVVADEGCMLYHIDINQGENRIVAYIAPEPLMKEAFEKGIDVHRLTASLIFGIPYDEVSNEPGSCPLGNGSQSYRSWGKKCNHSLNYGEGYAQFSLIYEISEKEGKFLHSRYHQMYPGIRQYWNWVVEEAKKNGRMLVNLFGRRRIFLGNWNDDLFKSMYSFIPQSTVADLINRRGLIPIYEEQDKYGVIDLLNQIHDAILFQISTEHQWQKHADAIMYLLESLSQPLEWHGTKFILPVELKVGLNLAEMEEIDYGSEASRLAELLHEVYRQHRIKQTIPSVDRDISYSFSSTEEM